MGKPELFEQATPRPWVAAPKASWFRGQSDPQQGKIAISAGSHGVIANAYGRHNADLIVAAVNAYTPDHTALIADLVVKSEAVLNDLRDYRGAVSSSVWADFEAAVHRAKALEAQP